MNDVKKLLDAATDLPWDSGDLTASGAFVNGPTEGVAYSETREDADLIVHAVNSLPAYEEAVEALERFVQFHGGHVLPLELAKSMTLARAALARLRGESA